MSAEEFWKDDPQLFVSYRTFFINKKQREIEENDYNCWLQGLYVYDGNSKLNALLRQQLGNMFAKTPNTKEIEGYSERPYIELSRKKREEQDDNKKYKDYQNSLIYYGSIKEIYKNRLIKGE